VEVEQRRDARIDREDHVAAAAAVTAVRPTEGLELLAVYRRAAVAAVARLDPQLSLVSELRHTSSPRRRARRPPIAREALAGLLGHLFSVRGNDADRAPAAPAAELDLASHQREKRVVSSAAYTNAGVEVRAPLAHEYLARTDDLAAESLDAKPLGAGVATVPA